ncbi:hypothetical protein [Salmonella phage SD-15_S21]|nr:hypothetical protein [Salmonella phage SD-15_S21]
MVNVNLDGFDNWTIGNYYLTSRFKLEVTVLHQTGKPDGLLFKRVRRGNMFTVVAFSSLYAPRQGSRKAS